MEGFVLIPAGAVSSIENMQAIDVLESFSRMFLAD